MPRATNNVAAHARHKKVLKQAAGYRGGKSRLYKTALEAVERGFGRAAPLRGERVGDCLGVVSDDLRQGVGPEVRRHGRLVGRRERAALHAAPEHDVVQVVEQPRPALTVVDADDPLRADA